MNTLASSPETVLSAVHTTTFETWIPFYAQRNDIYIDIDDSLEGVAAVPDTTQGEKLRIIINPRLCMEQYNFTPSEFLVVLFHRIEHLFEDAQLRASPEGEEVIKKREQRQQEQGIRASSYHELENVLRDMYVNEQVVDIKKVPALRQTLHDIYQKKLFAEKNYLQSPLHQQFLYAMIREHFVPEEKCEVAKEVRKALNTMQRKFLGLPSIFEKAITGDFAKRLQAIWDLVEPTFTKFLEEDIKNQNQPENPKNEEKQGENKEGGRISENYPENVGELEAENVGELGAENVGELEAENVGEGNTDSRDDSLSRTSYGSLPRPSEADKEGGENEKGGASSEHPNENPFEKGYKTMKHLFDEATQEKFEHQLTKNLQKKAEEAKEAQKSPAEKALEQRARNLIEEAAKKQLQQQGKDPNHPDYNDELKNLTDNLLHAPLFQQTLEALRNYQTTVQQLETIKDTETGKSVMGEILNLFEKIKSTRMKRKPFPKYPVDPDHGNRLHGPSLAEGVADYYSGNPNPEMFEMDSFREKRDKTVGKFEVMIVGDGSGSMDGNKNKQQAKAILLVFEALKRLHDKIKLNKEVFSTLVAFETEGYLFSESLENDYMQVKEKGSDFSDVERLAVYSMLGYAKGGTPDYKVLEDTYRAFMSATNSKIRQEINDKTTKKLIFVFSDGESADAHRLQQAIQARRAQGVFVYGIGIGDEADITHYLTHQQEQGSGEICSNPAQLAQIMKKLLVDIIK